MLESVSQGTDPDYGVPVFTGRADRRALFTLFGLPNAAPTEAEIERKGFVHALVSAARELYVDDDDNGRPMAVWLRGRGCSCR